MSRLPQCEVETWKPVVGWESLYEVSSHGRVRSLDRVTVSRTGVPMRFKGRTKRQNPNHEGYLQTYLVVNDRTKNASVHQLVIQAFVGPPPDGMQVNHIDGDKANNRIDNLEYCTNLQNLRHCIDVLGKKRGSRIAHAKLTESQIPDIRADKRSASKVAQDYGVRETAIHQVRKRMTWRHVP